MFSWKPAYSLGIEEVDAQHKKIFDFLNKLFTGSSLQHNKDTLKTILEELTQFAESHFATEARYMAKFHYPDMENHIADHKRLMDDLKTLDSYYNSGVSDQTIPLLQFMKQWITNHLATIDMQFYDFMKKNHADELNMFGV